MKTEDLIAEAISLPVEERERAGVVDTILKSLNQPESDMDKNWSEVAKQRLEELWSGQVQATKSLRGSGSISQNELLLPPRSGNRI